MCSPCGRAALSGASARACLCLSSTQAGNPELELWGWDGLLGCSSTSDRMQWGPNFAASVSATTSESNGEPAVPAGSLQGAAAVTPTQGSAPRDLDVDCSQLCRSWLQDNIISEQNFLAYLKIHLFEYGTPLILLQTKDGTKYLRQGCSLQRLQLSGFLVSNLEMKMQQFRKRSFHKLVMGPFNLVQTSCHACMKD